MAAQVWGPSRGAVERTRMVSLSRAMVDGWLGELINQSLFQHQGWWFLKVSCSNGLVNGDCLSEVNVGNYSAFKG